MNTTKILGEAVGVQWQGVTDQTETSTVTGLTQAIVIGRFKRGEVGKAMIIHQGNIRSMLGHEPTNPYYIAVQAVLDAGVPSVQVLRVADAAIGQEISCAGATSTLHYELTLNSSWNSNCYIELVINDEVFHVQINPPDAYAAWAVFGNYINNQFANRLQANWVSGNTGSVTVKTNEQFRIKATIVSDPGQSVGMLQFVDNGLNPTVSNFTGDQNFIPYSTVCLAPPEQNQISCAGATDYLGFERLDGDWDTHVDGVFYPSPYDPAATIRNELDEIIEAQNDGFADFWSRDTVPHRIKFAPRNTEGNPNSYILREENTNQSFAELPDGSLVFCLAAKQAAPPWDIEYVENGVTTRALTGNPIPASYKWNSPATALVINSTITEIGEAAFYNCQGMQSLTLPNTLTSVGKQAFLQCQSLMALVIPEGIKRIEQSAFEGCNSLASLELPSSLTTIDRYGFAINLTATTLVIPANVTSIGEYAFGNWDALESITVLAPTPPALGTDAFTTYVNGTQVPVPIYVPAASLSAYQTAPTWSQYSSRIQGLTI